jgi:hypothetical protein
MQYIGKPRLYFISYQLFLSLWLSLKLAFSCHNLPILMTLQWLLTYYIFRAMTKELHKRVNQTFRHRNIQMNDIWQRDTQQIGHYHTPHIFILFGCTVRCCNFYSIVPPDCPYAECHYVGWHYTKCRYDECYFGEWSGAKFAPQLTSSSWGFIIQKPGANVIYIFTAVIYKFSR